MRSKIKVNGKFYKPMPWLEEGCLGCDLDGNGCINSGDEDPCDDGYEFAGYIFVQMSPEGMARYVAARLEKAG
jgi:hypothetical protein